MKRLLIIIIVLILIVLIGFKFSKSDIINKSYREVKDNYSLDVNYPYFGNSYIDDYILSFTNSYVNDFKYSVRDNGSLFIDYDYDGDSLVVFYRYQVVDNMVSYNSSSICFKDSKIVKSNNYDSLYFDYDFYHNKVVSSSKKLVAFTFDDGPNYNTNRIVDILNSYNASATFFVLGSRIKNNHAIIEKLNSSGMEIGNHTFSHSLLTKMSEDDVINEIKKTNFLIFNITGRYPSLVRPSYGAFNGKIRNSVNMPIVIWNVDTLDWKYHNSKRIVNTILKNVSDGDIILMHDIYSSTVNAILEVIPKLYDMGYEIVSVSELFYYKNINLENGKVYSNAN